MKSLEQIIAPIAAEMRQFEAFFGQTMKADTEPMDGIMRYVAETHGKRLRPILVLLSAKLFGTPNAQTLRAATFVEMVHAATLIHDDVVDDDNQRRGQASVKARWDSRTAVLAGDYLLARAMQLLAQPADHAIMQEMLGTAAAMSEGELMQSDVGLSHGGDVGLSHGGDVGLSHCGDVGLSHGGSRDKPTRLPWYDSPTARYLDIITRKTATLMRSCCIAGALSVNATPEQVESLSAFGLNFGILFQLRDDLLDGENIGLANDLLPKQLEKTLHLIQDFPPSETSDALTNLTFFCARRGQ